MNTDLLFLKLGGSLITNKDRPHTARRRLIRRIADEIRLALIEKPNVRLVLGHGSGSFGHIPAARYGTREGVRSQEEWAGFIKVWREARALNQIVIEECLCAGLPVIAFPPSATFFADGDSSGFTSLPILRAALDAGLVPVVYGDVIFDSRKGATIFSTEEIFKILAKDLNPVKILLAGFEAGVYRDFSRRRNMIELITPESYTMESKATGASASIDVTGGMQKKVSLMVQLASQHPDLSIQIFSGRKPGSILKAIRGERNGTTIFSVSSKEGRP